MTIKQNPLNSGLTLTDIIRALGRDTPDQEKRTRSTLSRFLGESAEARFLLGASGPVRPTFPHAAVDVFRALLEASERGEVTPRMGAVWLTKNFPPVLIAAKTRNSENSEIEPKNKVKEAALSPQEMISLLAEAISEALAEAIPKRVDRLLTSSQASEMLACRPRSVSRYVKPVRRGIYRWSDVTKYIAALRLRE